MANEPGDFIEDLSSGFCSLSFRVDAQHLLRTGRANHHPAGFAKIHLDAVKVFAAGDRPVEEAIKFSISEMLEGLFLFGRA